MSDDPTPLSLPGNLPYPITLTRLLAQPGETVKRGTRLLEYSFMSREQRAAIDKRRQQALSANKEKDESDGNDLSGTWDCTIDGEVVNWEKGVAPGMIIERRDAKRSLLTVLQPCSHPVQLHGMCGICGADLTEDDYLATPAPTNSSNDAGPSRHRGGFEITHDAMGVTVSTNEAKRMETLTRDTLLSTRRLSLIVDLDQTIIHTTVDPTVAEWMNEIERDQQQQQHQASLSSTPSTLMTKDVADIDESTTPPTSPKISPTLLKEKNPNAEALKDVAKFQIADDLPPGHVNPKRKLRPGERLMEGPPRWYFTKPRPGLQTFLDNMSELYEMHVYTMGTRTYADAICKVIDPEGKIFGGRILSRDESGSFSSKNLKRLFPTDTSMVVVIDDRSDVWGDCPNLVKVVPYDFFIGIGDINSSFLPKLPKQPGASSASAIAPSPASSSSVSDASTPPPTTPPEDRTSPEDELLLKTKLLDEVSENRPLAKMQEELEKDTLDNDLGKAHHDPDNSVADEELPLENGDSAATPGSSPTTNDIEKGTTTPPASPSKPRKPLLNPNDYELLRVGNILREVHSTFYNAYDRSGQSYKGTSAPLPMNCDVEFIIPEIKGRVFEDCTLVFSGLIPQMVDPGRTEIWQTAETFGARCQTRVTEQTTHCVTATLNTEKTYFANKYGAKVVWSNWFWDSVALWKRQDEGKYLAGSGSGKSGSNTPKSKAASPTPDSGNGPSTVADDENEESSVGEQDKREEGTIDEGDDHFGEKEGHGWDAGADEEFEAFMAGDDEIDFGTDVGSVSDIGSTPPTPSKKRVRYADEEFLPLEEFKEPTITEPGAGAESPPKKKKKPLLLLAPKEGEVPESNKFEYREKGSYAKGTGNDNDEKVMHITEMEAEAGETEKEVGQPHSEQGDSASEPAEEDEFAMMLMDSLADDGDGEGVDDDEED